MIPETLKNMPIWVLFRFQREENGHTKKTPFSALYSGHASSTKPSTWSCYETASRRMQQGGFDSLGIAITGGLVFVDLDDCIDQDGQFSKLAKDVISRFPCAYIERSQSARGVHILTRGTLPRAVKRKSVEMYGQARFCCITGDTLQAAEPVEEQESIDYVFQKYKNPDMKAVERPQYEMRKTDSEVIELLCRNPQARDLFNGSWRGRFESQSQADLALCSKLAFWTNRNAEAMDRIFTQSGLFREKWLRADYRERTIERAISGCAVCVKEWKEVRHDTWKDRLNELALRQTT